jgi:hypothetical protein
MLSEFKKFIMRGNVLDLAIGVIIGAAFGKIVTSLVNDVLMPVIGLVIGKVDFSALFVNLRPGTPVATLAEAKAVPRMHHRDPFGGQAMPGLHGCNCVDQVWVRFVIFLPLTLTAPGGRGSVRRRWVRFVLIKKPATEVTGLF